MMAAAGQDLDEEPPYLQSFGGLEQCAEAIERMLSGDPGRQISMLLLVSDEDIVETVKRAGPGVKIEKRGGTRPNIAVSLKVTGKTGDRTGRLFIVQAGVPQIYLAFTHEKAPFVSALPSVLERMHPYAFVAGFSSGEIRDMLGLLESRTGLGLTTRRIAAHKNIGKKAAYARKARRLRPSVVRKESEITYTGVPYRESIKSALEDGRQIDKAQFVLSKGGDVSLEGHLSRGGLFKFRHSFLIFKKYVLPHALGLSAGKFELYSNRSRKDNGGDVSPLAIRLDAGVLGDREQNRRFVKAVQSMKYTSSGVYHSDSHVNMLL